MKIWNNVSAYFLTAEIGKALSKASPEVKAFAEPMVKKAYHEIPKQLVAKNGALLVRGSQTMRIYTSSMLQQLPGGNEFIRFLPKKTSAYAANGNEQDMYVYKEFKSAPQFVGKWFHLTKRYEKTLTDPILQRNVDETFRQIDLQKKQSGSNGFRATYLTRMMAIFNETPTAFGQGTC